MTVMRALIAAILTCLVVGYVGHITSEAIAKAAADVCQAGLMQK